MEIDFAVNALGGGEKLCLLLCEPKCQKNSGQTNEWFNSSEMNLKITQPISMASINLFFASQRIYFSYEF